MIETRQQRDARLATEAADRRRRMETYATKNGSNGAELPPPPKTLRNIKPASELLRNSKPAVMSRAAYMREYRKKRKPKLCPHCGKAL